MELYCWCVRPSHLHLIFRAKNNNLDVLLGRFKEFIYKQLDAQIKVSNEESRKEWMFERASSKSSNVKSTQLWQQHNKPIEIWSDEALRQNQNTFIIILQHRVLFQNQTFGNMAVRQIIQGGNGLIDISHVIQKCTHDTRAPAGVFSGKMKKINKPKAL